MNSILHALDMLSWFPENISTFGQELDNLFGIIYYLCVAIFVLTFGIMGYFLVVYRYRPNRKAHNYHGNNLVEITWTVLPTILFGALGIYSDDIWERTKYSKRIPTPEVEILIMAKTYGWQFLYPGADGKFGRNSYTDRTARNLMTAVNPFGIDSTDPASADDFTTENAFTVPVNANIVMRGSSQDVLHSFFLPNMRVKQDVVPGTWMNIWYNAFKTGKYEVACAELCGGGHYGMRADYEVMSKSEYDKWLDKKAFETKSILDAKNGVVAPTPATSAVDSTASTASSTHS